jgi:hypothetical protein
MTCVQSVVGSWTVSSSSISSSAPQVKGMQLGHKPKAANYFDALKKEEGFVDSMPTSTSVAKAQPISTTPREA